MLDNAKRSLVFAFRATVGLMAAAAAFAGFLLLMKLASDGYGAPGALAVFAAGIFSALFAIHFILER